MIRITYDPEADAAYIYFRERKFSGEGYVTELKDSKERICIIADADAEHKVMGLEFLCASKVLPKELLDQAERIE